MWALVTCGSVLPCCMLPLSVRRPHRVGPARRPDGAWASTALAVSFMVSAAALLAAALEFGRLAPKAQPAVVGALAIGVLLGVLAFTLSSWRNHRGVVYFHPNRRVTLTIATLATLRIVYGLWRVWSARGSATIDRPWLSAVGIAGTLAAAALLAGYGLGFWASVRVRIARWKAISMFVADTSTRHPPSIGPARAR